MLGTDFILRHPHNYYTQPHKTWEMIDVVSVSQSSTGVMSQEHLHPPRYICGVTVRACDPWSIMAAHQNNGVSCRP